MVTPLLTRVVNRTSLPQTGSRGGISFFSSGVDTGNRKTQLETYGCVSTLFAIVNRLAADVAAVDWKLYVKSTDGRRSFGPATDTRREVTRHIALQVWNKPSKFYTRQELVESFQQHVDLCGEADLLVTRPEGFVVPTGLQVLRPDRIDPVPDPEEFLLGYVYTDFDGKKVKLETDEIIQIRMPNPMDPYRGLGPVTSLLIDLDASEMAARWNANFFRNSAIPGAAIEIPNTWTDNTFKRFRTQLREQHRGVANAHRTMLLEDGAKWVNTSYSMKDMQFTELRGVSREMIMEGFGFPKFMLGRVDDVNRANAIASRDFYNQNLLRPRLERIKLALNNDFLPLFGSMGEGYEFEYCLETPEDPDQINAERTSKATAFATLVGAGADPIYAAEVCGLPEPTMKEVQSVPEGEPTPA
jgi:HK97 family phage portal protein